MPHEGVAGPCQIGAMFGDIGEVQEGLRIHRKRRGGTPQHLLGLLPLRPEQVSAAEQREALAADGSRGNRGAKRFDGLVQRNVVATGLGGRQPDPAQVDVSGAVHGLAIGGLADRRDREVRPTCLGVGDAQRHLPLGSRIDGHQSLQLGEGLARLTLGPLEADELISDVQELRPRVQGPSQRRAGLVDLSALAQAQAEDVLSFREIRLQGDGLSKRRNGAADIAEPEPGETQLVENARGSVVHLGIGAIALGCSGESFERVVDVAEEFDRARVRGVERDCGSQIPQGCDVVAALPIRLAPFQVTQHRCGPERDGATEGLDRLVAPVGGEGCLALANQAPVLSFSCADIVGGRGTQHGADAQSEQKPAFHRRGRPNLHPRHRRNFRGDCVSNIVQLF